MKGEHRREQPPINSLRRGDSSVLVWDIHLFPNCDVCHSFRMLTSVIVMNNEILILAHWPIKFGYLPVDEESRFNCIWFLWEISFFLISEFVVCNALIVSNKFPDLISSVVLWSPYVRSSTCSVVTDSMSGSDSVGSVVLWLRSKNHTLNLFSWMDSVTSLSGLSKLSFVASTVDSVLVNISLIDSVMLLDWIAEGDSVVQLFLVLIAGFTSIVLVILDSITLVVTLKSTLARETFDFSAPVAAWVTCIRVVEILIGKLVDDTGVDGDVLGDNVVWTLEAVVVVDIPELEIFWLVK